MCDEIFWCFNQTGKGLTKGDWKISSISDGPWRLYEAVNVYTIGWQAALEPGHPSKGSNQVMFTNLPRLKPNTTCFALSDSCWITVGGKGAIGTNDGAFW